MDTFDIQDEMFSLFIADSVLTELLGIADATDIILCDSKIRRQQQDSTLLKPEMLDFFDYSFIDATKTGNFLVNHGILEFNIYAGKRNDASLICKSIRRILKKNYEDMHVYSEQQAGCPIENIFCYCLRVRPTIDS